MAYDKKNNPHSAEKGLAIILEGPSEDMEEKEEAYEDAGKQILEAIEDGDGKAVAHAIHMLFQMYQ